MIAVLGLCSGIPYCTIHGHREACMIAVLGLSAGIPYCTIHGHREACMIAVFLVLVQASLTALYMAIGRPV